MIKRHFFVKKRERSQVSRFLIDLVKSILGFIYKGKINRSIKPSKNKLITLLNNILFSMRESEELETGIFINFTNKNIYEIEYGEYTVPALIIKNNEEITSEITINENEFILLGIGILDERLKHSEDYHLKISISLVSKNNNELVKSFSIPINRGKTLLKTVGSYFRGKEFVELSINPKSLGLPYETYELKILTEFSRNSGKRLSYSLPRVAIKSPRVFKNDNNKKILLIGCESLTDPFWLLDKHKINLNLPGFSELINDGSYFSNSYSQQDGTLPFMSTMSTGLFPSQHLLGNYSKPIYEHKLHSNLDTLGELLSKNGFATDALTPVGRWDTSYGWSRGYDSFKVSKSSWDDTAPNFSNLSNLITKNKNNDSFIFAHIDRMHIPLLQFVPNQSPNLNDLCDLDQMMNNNFYPTIFKNIVKLDKIIYDIIQTLKYENIYEETMIVLTGDHGISIPPNWKQGLEFAQYEEHIRVPYIIKQPKWTNDNEFFNTIKVNNASTRIFSDIMKAVGISLPKYFKDTSQLESSYQDLAFSETTYHPKYKNYGLSIISDNVKYWFNCNMDWKNFKVDEITNEKMFIKNDNNMFDENNNLVEKDVNKRKRYKEIGLEFLNKNLNFHKKSILNKIQ
tara:strand:+ start:5902 stop:7779 length:1878 start_codon:yes stop_codon:yes gene_type:complete